MSTEILEALVRLFAIVAKQDDGASFTERESVKKFLSKQISQNAVEQYIAQFDKYTEEQKTTAGSKRKTFVSDSTKTLRICTQINKELSQNQKVIVVIRLLEMIYSDKGKMTESTQDFINTVVDVFNLNKREFNLVKQFVFEDEKIDSQNFLSISESNKRNNSSKFIQRKNLAGEVLILRIESLKSYFMKYKGEEELRLNGLVIVPHSLYVFAVGSSIRHPKIKSIYYSDVVGEFLTGEKSIKLNFEAKNLIFEYTKDGSGVKNVSISEQNRHLVGIMGASGAGKTTLVNILSGKQKPQSGSVTINGIDIYNDPEKTKGVIGFIPQDDFLIENLTVFENLYYSAKLSISHKSEFEILSTVNKTLRKLGLYEIKNNIIGDSTSQNISGGQRKRLNIALELIREPSILFVDEPTSGLSSRDSENIMDLLKELALSGKLVFVVIHQPSSELFKMFDNLLIMDYGGYPIYYGNPVEAIMYFKHHTHQLNSEEAECELCGNVNSEQIFGIIEAKVVDEYGEFTNERRISPQEWNRKFEGQKKAASENIDSEKLTFPQRSHIPGFFHQIKIFTLRDVISKIRNKQYLFILIAQAPFLAIILAFATRYYDKPHHFEYNLYNNDNLVSYIFMSVIVAIFFGLTMSAQEIFKDRKILHREQFLQLNRLAYILSKITIVFSVSAFQTILFVMIGNYILEIKDLTLNYWMVLFSASCFGNVLGLNISSAFKSAVTIYIFIPILIIPQLLFSGVVVPFDKLNPDFASHKHVPVIGDLTTSRWAFEALAYTQFTENKYRKYFFEHEREASFSEYKRNYYIPRLQRALRNIDDKNEKTLLYNELENEAKIIATPIKEIHLLLKDELTRNDINSIDTVIKKLEVYYAKRVRYASDKKSEILDSMGNQRVIIRNQHDNSYLDDLMKGIKSENSFYVEDDRIIQKIYPVCNYPYKYSKLDYREPFLSGTKQFMNKNYTSFDFNTTVIWLFNIVLLITLYFDSFKRLIELNIQKKLFIK